MLATTITEFSLPDLLAPALLDHPYPLFQRLRAESPIHEDPTGQGWIITRYDDIASLLGDRRLSAQRLITLEEKIRGVNPIIAGLSRQMLFQDPPNHTRLRRLVAGAFTPQRIEGLRPDVLRMTTKLLDEAERDGGCIDFMRSIAVPLPVAVIARMLGLPPDDNQQLQEWSLSFGSLINGRTLDSDEIMAAQRGVYNLIRYLTRLIGEKRRSPGNDMLTDLIAAEQDGDRLDTEELIMNVILLFAAGHGTTTHLLGNAVLALMQNPEEFRLLSEDASIASSAVNELLRFDGPIQLTVRVAAEDIPMRDPEGTEKLIRKNDKVTLVLASANRDESRFSWPDRLDLRRNGGRSLSFGHGLHACVGAALGRMEAEVVLSELARRFPSTWLENNQPKRLRTIVFRGLEELPLTLT